MATVVDSQNVVRSPEDIPDGLRGEIGTYYSPEELRSDDSTATGNFLKFNDKINSNSSFIVDLGSNDQVLIPTKKSRVLFTGREDAFRDQTQWNTYVSQIVSEGGQNLDHQFNLDTPTIENSFHKKLP